jgi:hypothetical protein
MCCDNRFQSDIVRGGNVSSLKSSGIEIGTFSGISLNQFNNLLTKIRPGCIHCETKFNLPNKDCNSFNLFLVEWYKEGQ